MKKKNNKNGTSRPRTGVSPLCVPPCSAVGGLGDDIRLRKCFCCGDGDEENGYYKGWYKIDDMYACDSCGDIISLAKALMRDCERQLRD